LKNNKKKESLPPVNEEIRVRTVQLINQNGENIGVISRDEALKLAVAVDLDLVMIAPKGNEGIPVVKIMDFGKALYEKKKKQAEAKKKQKVIQVKELKFRPKIGEHDFLTKMKRGVEFLKAGKYLKITLMFRGREIATKNERGTELFKEIEKSLKEAGILDDLVKEKESRAGQFWSRIYYLKTVK
jgi:translation initiation factor IF-3